MTRIWQRIDDVSHLGAEEVAAMEGAIAAAAGEIVRMRQIRLASRWPRERLTNAITAIDLALEALEGLNLAERSIIPEVDADYLSQLLRSVPCQLRPSVAQGGSIERLMDDLYFAQESLLIERSESKWDDLRQSEVELSDSA
jgi:hypothetical protein